MTKLCIDCPDHEACMTGYSCEYVRRINPPVGETIDSLSDVLVWEGDYA